MLIDDNETSVGEIGLYLQASAMVAGDALGLGAKEDMAAALLPKEDATAPMLATESVATASVSTVSRTPPLAPPPARRRRRISLRLVANSVAMLCGLTVVYGAASTLGLRADAPILVRRASSLMIMPVAIFQLVLAKVAVALSGGLVQATRVLRLA